MKSSPQGEKQLRRTSRVFLAVWVVAIFMIVWGKDLLPPLVSRIVVVSLLMAVVYCVVVGGTAITESLKQLKRTVFEPQSPEPTIEHDNSEPGRNVTSELPEHARASNVEEESSTSHANNAR
jgi:hypothetical protein